MIYNVIHMSKSTPKSNASLNKYSKFGIGGTAKHFAKLTKKNDVSGLSDFARKKDVPLTVIGEGSNTVFSGAKINRLIVKNELKGVDAYKEGGSVKVKIQAGENWDDVVSWSVRNGFSGLEALSAIPGSVGAAPIQNIGAYGSQLSDVLSQLEVFDTKTDSFAALSCDQCEFGYRTSRFKREPGRFVVLSITLNLSTKDPEMPDYEDVKTYFEKRGVEQPTLNQIREAIVEIRWGKLPRPTETPNLGSFFKNPVVSRDFFEDDLSEFSDMPYYELEKGIKIPAGWLIEEVGLKGKEFGSVGVYKENALVLVSKQRADFADLAKAIGEIRHRVHNQFGIELEREPQILC